MPWSVAYILRKYPYKVVVSNDEFLFIVCHAILYIVNNAST